MAEQEGRDQRPPASSSSTDDSKGGLISAIDHALETSKSGAMTAGPEGNEGAGPRGLRLRNFIPFIVVVVSGLAAVNYLKQQERILQDPTQNIPRLAHVVSEYQGTRRINLVGGMVMMLTGVGGLLAMILYRRDRVRKARIHDSMFWFLAVMSMFFGCIFIVWRWRRRRHDAVRSALNEMGRKTTQLTRYYALALPLIPVMLVLYLLFYRRQRHRVHQRRRKKHHMDDKTHIM